MIVFPRPEGIAVNRLLFVPGSLRTASASRATVRALVRRLEGRAEMVFADTGKLSLYNADITDNPEVLAFIEQVRMSDGVVFVAPEYNYSVPGVLKNAIDWASRPAYALVFLGKPCFLMSVSGGALGGVRAQAHLQYILNEMLAEVYTCKKIVVTIANTKVKDGILDDETVLAFADECLAGFLKSLN